MKHFSAFILVLFIVFAGTVQAQNSSIKLVLFSQGFSFPLGVENCGDSRLFIVQKGGQIIIADSNANRITTPFLDIKGRVTSTGDETGLLGLAFDPNYKTNGLFYVNYIDKSGNTQISQFKVTVNPNIADSNSEKKVLAIPQPYGNHVGGCIRFGPGGFLYIGMGDGDGAAVGDPNNYAQNPSLLLGKFLRIKPKPNGTYVIPAGNPFVDSVNYRKEIWAIGLRNPWRFSFDSQTGALFIGDVGEGSYEEVDLQVPNSKGGQNYGWRCYEGNHAYNTTGCKPMSAYVAPVYEYTHSGSPISDCAITGGFVYRGKKYADLAGKYFFTDFCSGVIRTLTFKGVKVDKEEVALNSGIIYALTSFGEDYKHELYVVSSAGGAIYRIVSAAASNVASQENPVAMAVYPNPAQKTFSVKYTTQKAEACVVSVYASNGRQVYSETKTSLSGDNIWKITLPDYAKGNCYVMVSSLSGDVIRQNIVVR